VTDASARLLLGDCIEVMASLDAESVDAVVCDPPYGIEFMGRDWDKFIPHDRVQMSPRWANAKRADPTTSNWGDGESEKFGNLPSYGGRRNSYQCQTCGKRDAFRNPHKCGDAADWRVVPSYAGASPDVLAFEEFSKAWATEAYRVLKPGGHLLAFGATRMYHRLTSGVEDAGFEIRDSLHWIYGSGFPKSLNVSYAIDKKAGAARPDRAVGGPGSTRCCPGRRVTSRTRATRSPTTRSGGRGGAPA
jgi:DNA modification methylase